jgi:nitrous oxide reductase
MAKTDTKSLPRREFLKAAGVTGAAAGVAAVTLSGTDANAAAPDSRKTSGYQETDHVKTYYELARF